MKKYTTKAARAECPDGKESFLEERLLLVEGRLLLVNAFNTAITIMSSISPKIIIFF